MEKFKLSEEKAYSLVKEVLINWYSCSELVEIRKYFTDDNGVGFDAVDEEYYHGEAVKRLIPLEKMGMIMLLKSALEAKGYDNVFINVDNDQGQVSFTISAVVAEFGKKAKNGLYKRRKNR